MVPPYHHHGRSWDGRAALKGSSCLKDHHLNRGAGGVGIGAQAWGLSKKLREADETMSPEQQLLICEVHPELQQREWSPSRMAVFVSGPTLSCPGRKALSAEIGPDTVVRSLSPMLIRDHMSALRGLLPTSITSDDAEADVIQPFVTRECTSGGAISRGPCIVTKGPRRP